MRLFALAQSRGAGTASGAPSIVHWGATAATCQTIAYWDASTAYEWATTTAMTISGAAWTVEPGDDHAAGLVIPLH
jgi:hypothetical protein